MAMNDYSILVVDDNQLVLRSLKLVLKNVFRTVNTLADPKAIMGLVLSAKPDVVLLDMNFDARKLDGEEGLFWLNQINSLDKSPAVVLITAFGDIDLAVRSVQQGAEDFVTKPWTNDVLIQKLENAVVNHRIKNDKAALLAKATELQGQIEADRHLNLEDMERKHILDVIEEEGGSLVNAASHLEISRQTLYNKLKKYGILK